MSIVKIREEIDRLDDEIVDLIKSRMDLVLSMSIEKSIERKPIFDKKRENEICDRLCKEAQDMVIKEHIPMIYQQILSCSKAIQALKKNPIFPFKRLGIVGLGLMGASIASVLKWKSPHIHLVGYDPKGCVFVDEEVSSISEFCTKVDALIITSPISTVNQIAIELSKCPWPEHVIIWDIASVKREQKALFENLSKGNLEYVATHPMSGGTSQGPGESKLSMFAMRPWVLCPHKNNQLKSISKIEKAIHYFGSFPIYMDAEEHDRCVSMVSHLPKMISLGLLRLAAKHPKSETIAGRGFELMTTLGKGNQELIQDLIQTNKENVVSALEECTQIVTEILTKDVSKVRKETHIS